VEKYFKPEDTYENAIREGEVGVLRALLTGIIGSDPTFVTTEFEEALEYIRTRSKDFNGHELVLTEEYKKQEDEYEKEEEKWDEHYFQMNLVWLRDNFSLSKRLPLIRKVGEKVYQNKVTLGKSKVERRQPIAAESLDSTICSSSKKDKTARATGGGGNIKNRLFGSSWDILSDYWWAFMIILVLVALVVMGFKAN